VQDCFFNASGPSDFGSVEAAHRALVEQVVEVDAAFVDRYLNDGDVPASELHEPLEQALREGHLIPVLFTAAKSGIGIPELLSVIDKLLPNPLEANPPAFERSEGDASELVRVKADPAEHVIAHVFQVRADPFLGKMGLLRVHQGTLTKNMQLFVGHGRKPVRVGHLFALQGKTQVPIDKAVPGDLCAVAKLDELHPDAVLHDAAEDEHLHLAPLQVPTPVHGLALAPTRHGDEQRLWDVMHRLVEEDPCLKLEHERADPRDPGLRTGGAAPAHADGAAQGDLQVRGEDAAAAHRLPRDRQQPGRGPPPPQEADRRRRPVRRGLPAHRAAGARRRLRVRRRRQGRRDSRASSCRRWRRACARPARWAWWPATRWWT
jgi:hypothetical protein